MEPAVQPAAAPAAPPPPAPAAAPAAPATPPPAAPVAQPKEPAAPAAVALPAPAAQPPKPEDKKTDDKPLAPVISLEEWKQFKLPEGAQFDEKALGEFKTIMADAKMTPAQKAQALVDFQWNLQLAQAKAFEEALAKQSTAWLESIKADKEFGGANFDKTVAGAKSAEAQFFGEDASKLFKELGIQNHPALVKGLARIRALVSEDKAAGLVGDPPAADPNSVEATLKRQFPKSWPQMLQAHKNKLARSGTR